jgi:hypothetical protein
MPLQIVRPRELSKDKKDELRFYLHEQWKRAERARAIQVDSDYEAWGKAYAGTPLEESRTVPFYKASNLVVKLIRIFADTFLSRTLNIIFATRPLYVNEGLPRELKESWENYLNRKALYEWGHYLLARALITGGNKNGTTVIKTVWTEETTVDVMATSDSSYTEKEVTTFAGPLSCPISFDDFYIYPITAYKPLNAPQSDALIKFHRLRYVEERARELAENGKWDIPDNRDVAQYFKMPNDVQRTQQQGDAGVQDSLLREMQAVECHLRYAITNDSKKMYDCVCIIEPENGDLLDVYYNPYPRNICIFNDYRPFPRENLFFGESLCQLLGSAQEEATRIHNERRDNSMISNTVMFKRKSGSLVPNPSTNMYPGKVWDLESMDDFDVINWGRNYEETISQEDYVFQLAEKLTGTGEVMQGASSGTMGKRGVYNSMGTIAMMQESNQRQDTNIRDVREVLSAIASLSSTQQAWFGANDPLIATFTEEDQVNIAKCLELFKQPEARYFRHEVKASDAGVNKEVERMNLMQSAQVINQYGQAVVQMVTQLANPTLNPAIKAITLSTASMMKFMAQRMLEQFDEFDAKEMVPDVNDALAQLGRQTDPGGVPVPGGTPNAMGSNQPGGAPGLPSRSAVQTLATLPLPNGAATQQ